MAIDKNQTIWRVRYINNNETKLRSIEVITDENDIDQLFDELEQFEDEAKIVSIRNRSVKLERKSKR